MTDSKEIELTMQRCNVSVFIREGIVSKSIHFFASPFISFALFGAPEGQTAEIHISITSGEGPLEYRGVEYQLGLCTLVQGRHNPQIILVLEEKLVDDIIRERERIDTMSFKFDRDVIWRDGVTFDEDGLKGDVLYFQGEAEIFQFKYKLEESKSPMLRVLNDLRKALKSS